MSNISALQNQLSDQFSRILAPERILLDQAALEHYGRDWLKDFKPAAALILLPEKIDELQAIVSLCAAQGIAIVPSGGRTGLSGGATATNGEVVVSLERMRAILEINRVDRTARCQAGVTIEQLQVAAAAQGLYFPVDFSSRGSAQIGGAIATNAGGIRVIKYGNIRSSVLGLKVITGGGELLELNGSLFKNNSGYDLRNLFIGSEGSLGIIVEATLTLASPPKDIVRALCGLASIDDLLPLLTYCRDELPNLSAFECMERLPFAEVVTRRGLRDPLSQPYPAYALIECELSAEGDLERATTILAQAYERGLAQDIVVSESTAQANELMNLRDYISETLSQHYTLHKNDISVPICSIPAFLNELHSTLKSTYPSFQIAVFGHVGDGNLHVNVLKPSSMSDQEFWDKCHEADHVVFRCVAAHSGSVSAEHGVGLLKRDYIHYTRSAAEIEYMRGIKRVFDPKGIMNPGKVLAL